MIKKNIIPFYNDPYITNSNVFSITLIMISFIILTISFNITYGFYLLIIFMLIALFMNLPRLRKRRI